MEEKDSNQDTLRSVHVEERSQSTPVTLKQSLKTHRKIVAVALGLSVAILLYGFDNVIVSSISAVPAFQDDFGERLDGQVILPSSWLGAWTAAVPVGMVLGALAAGLFQDRFGRRASIAVGNIIISLGVAVCFVSNLPRAQVARRGAFLGGKGIQGIGLGMLICTTQTFLSEIAPSSLRGATMALVPIFTLLGQLLGSSVVFALHGVDGSRSYTLAFASQWPFSAVSFVITAIVPESPTFLLRKGRRDQAAKAQNRLYPSDLAPAALAQVAETLAHETSVDGVEKPSFLRCFAAADRRRTWIVLYSFNIPQFFGITLLANASYFLQTVGMEAGNSLKFLIVGIGIGILANCLSIWTLAAFRRRALLISSLLIAAALWASVGIAGCFTGVIAVWYIAASMMLITFVCGCGAWPSSVVVSSETSSLQLRGLSQSLGWLSHGLSSGLFSIILPYIFNPDSGNLRGMTGFVFASLSLVATVLCWLFIPEMKGKTAAEIDALFESKTPARQAREHDSVKTP